MKKIVLIMFMFLFSIVGYSQMNRYVRYSNDYRGIFENKYHFKNMLDHQYYENNIRSEKHHDNSIRYHHMMVESWMLNIDTWFNNDTKEEDIKLENWMFDFSLK